MNDKSAVNINRERTRWWSYDELPSGEPYDWGGAARGGHPDDQTDFHLDLGAGRLPKGRLAIDRYDDDCTDLVMDLNELHVAGVTSEKIDFTKHPDPGAELIPIQGRMPFPSDSIESIISHHALEHVGEGFIRLMDECYRVLKPGGIFRIIVPFFPSHSAVADPDHKRYFLEGTFESFCGDAEGNSWLESFSTPYTMARFIKTHQTFTERNQNPALWWTQDDQRELRVTLTK